MGFRQNASENSSHQEQFRRSEEIDLEDFTCCHRATCCNPVLRDIMIFQPVSKCCLTNFTYSTLFWLMTVIAMILMSYAILYFYIGDRLLPDGTLFGLIVVIISAYFLGWTIAYIPYLNIPPVFGMLLAGIIIRNAKWYDIQEELGSGILSKIRTFSVTFVLLRAGLQLTSSALRENPLFVLILAVVPCTIEMLTMAVCAYSLLDYPWAWAFLIGSIIACMSPVVPVNCIIALAERGYGEDKEIPTLLFTAVSIDDIHIVALYAIFFSFIFAHDKSESTWWSYYLVGLRDLAIGAVVGALLGLFFTFFPHRKHKYVLWYRVVSLVLGSLMCTTAPSEIAITGGGFLATIVMSLIATTGWRILTVPFDVKPLRRAVSIMWHLMQPVLVGVIGADIDFHNWSLSRFGLYCVCILVGVLVRAVFAFLSTFRTPFNMKERTFIALSWISKGTLQAALAPMVLEQATKTGDRENIYLATDVLRLTVVSVVFLAPLSALIMMCTGPVLLSKTSDEEYRRRRELSYLKIVSLQPVRNRR